MLASEKGNSAAVRLLIDNGANVNLRNKYGQTALIIAVKEKQSDAAGILVRSGADVKVKDNEGKTAVDFSADPRVIELLSGS